MTKISIFTPVHRTDKLFDLCVESILKQSEIDWEWVILDNTSDLRIKKYFEDKWLLQNQRFKMFYETRKIKIYEWTKNEKTIGDLKRTAALLCTGELILEHDCDDWLDENALKYLKAADEKYDCDFYYSDWFCMYYDGTETEFIKQDFTHRPIDKTFVKIPFYKTYLKNYELSVFGRLEMTYDTFSHFESPLAFRAWKREAYIMLGGHDISLNNAEDFELVIRTVLNSNKICRISFPCCWYLKNDYGVGAKMPYWKIVKTHTDIMEKYHKELEDKNVHIIRYIPK